MTFDYVSWEAFATLITGILAVGAAVWVGLKQQKITAQQLENERLSLRLELFEKRYEFYDVLTRYIRATRFKNGVSAILEREFAAKSRKGLLLFPKSSADLINKIASLGDEYQDLAEVKVSPEDSIRKPALARRKAIRARQDELFQAFDSIAESAMRIEA